SWRFSYCELESRDALRVGRPSLLTDLRRIGVANHDATPGEAPAVRAQGTRLTWLAEQLVQLLVELDDAGLDPGSQHRVAVFRRLEDADSSHARPLAAHRRERRRIQRDLVGLTFEFERAHDLP